MPRVCHVTESGIRCLLREFDARFAPGTPEPTADVKRITAAMKAVLAMGAGRAYLGGDDAYATDEPEGGDARAEHADDADATIPEDDPGNGDIGDDPGKTPGGRGRGRTRVRGRRRWASEAHGRQRR